MARIGRGAGVSGSLPAACGLPGVSWDRGRCVRLLVAGPAAEVLCERSRGAGMVVVDGRGLAGGFPGLLMGSVSLPVAAFARGPVVVVRGHWRSAARYIPGPVVVGADGSAASRSALGFGFEEAVLREAPLLAVCALADAPGDPGGARQIREDFEKLLDEAEQGSPEVTVRRRVADAGARAALLAAAQDAQMLVVGSRGRGGMRDMVLGSVSQAVLYHARCPVGVVHPR